MHYCEERGFFLGPDSFFNGIQMGAPLQKKNQVMQWSLHYKKNQVVQWSLHCKKKESGTCGRGESCDPIAPLEVNRFQMELSRDIPTAPGLSLQPPARPPNNQATTTQWSFFVCSMFPLPNVHIKSYTTTMSSTNLHNTKMIFLIVRSLRLYFYAIAAPGGWIRQHSMPNLTIALTKPRLRLAAFLRTLQRTQNFKVWFFLTR